MFLFGIELLKGSILYEDYNVIKKVDHHFFQKIVKVDIIELLMMRFIEAV